MSAGTAITSLPTTGMTTGVPTVRKCGLVTDVVGSASSLPSLVPFLPRSVSTSSHPSGHAVGSPLILGLHLFGTALGPNSVPPVDIS